MGGGFWRDFFDDFGVAFAAVVVLEAFFGVALGGDVEVGGLAAEVLGVEVLQERDAPLAAGAGGEALGDEGGDGGVLDGEVGADLAEGDSEAEADVVVGVHGEVESGK